MAINLQAVARLNIRPFTQSLATLRTQINSLYGTQLSSSKAAQKAINDEATARTRGAQRVVRASNSVNAATRAGAAATKDAAQAAMALGEAQAIAANRARSLATAIEGVTPAQRRLTATQQAAISAELRHADAIARHGVTSRQAITTGQALDRAIARRAAAESAVTTETNKRIAAERAAIETTRRNTEATRSGAEAARRFAAATAGMTEANRRRAQLANNVAAAELRLASAIAAAGGAEAAKTPRVLAAESALISAQGAQAKYNESIRQGIRHNSGFSSSLAVQRHMYSDMSRQALTASAILLSLPGVGLGVASSWERSFSDVVRTADPAFSQIEERSEALRRTLIATAQSMPASFGAITEIATLAHQMGIASEDVAEFTRVVAMFSATSGVSVDLAATAFGRLTAILGDARIPFLDMADSILKVGVNSVATEEEIINVTTQISSIAAAAGFSAKEMIGLSGALASVRVPPELSRGVITRVFGRIDQAVSQGGSRLEAFAAISGTTADQVRKDWGGAGSADLFNSFLKGLRDMGSAARSELQNLGITSVRDVPVILRLATTADSEGNVGELFTQTLRDAHNAAGETQRQYTIMADTVVGRLKILGNNILAFFNAVGSSGLGMFGDVIRNISGGLRNFTRDLDKPMKILGSIKLPWTNADALAFATTIASIAGGFMLLAALGTQIAKVFTTFRQFRETVANSSIIRGLKNIGDSATEAAGGFVNYSSGAAAATKATTGWATTLSRIGVGAGIAAIGGVIFMFQKLVRDAEAAATSVSDLAESFASIDVSSIREVDEVLKSIEVVRAGDIGLGSFFDKDFTTKPFVNGVDDMREAIENLYTIEPVEPSGGWWDWEFAGELASAGLPDLEKIINTDAVNKIDKAIQSLVDSGNTDKAIRLIQTLASSGEDLQLFLDTAPNSMKLLEDAFGIAGIEMTAENLDKLANGILPALRDAVHGVAGATEAAELFTDGDVERLGEMASKLDEAAAAFINLGEAVDAATSRDDDGNIIDFDLGTFVTELDAQVEAQRKWADNLAIIGREAGVEVRNYLAELGPEHAYAIEEMARAVEAGEPMVLEAFESIGRNLEASNFAEGMGMLLDDAVVQWFRNLIDDKQLEDALFKQFDNIDLMLLHEAGQGIASDVLQGIIQEFAETGDIDKALRDLLMAQDPIKPAIEFDDDSAAKSLEAVQAKLRQRFKHNAFDLNIDAGTTVEDLAHTLKTRLNDPELSELEIDGKLTLHEAYEQSREFQVWAKEQGIDMFLGVDDTPARFGVEALKALAEDEKLELVLDALPELAEGKFWELVEDTDGYAVFVQVDAETGKAIENTDTMVNKINQKTATIGVYADTSSFSASVSGLFGYLGTATIGVNAISNPHFADGGIVERYAKGGIRSQHTAQIAQAGAMRVWAEPETEGEAYIPFARSKRTRSTAILGQVANNFGYALVPHGGQVAKFADGGFFQAQMFARYTQMLGNIANSAGSGGSGSDRNVSFTFVNPVTRDPMQDAWEKMRLVGKDL